jgi:hypothetical protein
MTPRESDLMGYFENELDCYHGFLATAEFHKKRYFKGIDEFCEVLKSRIQNDERPILQNQDKTAETPKKQPKYDAS